MNLKDLHARVRAYARDFNNSIFRKEDITAFLNEGIDRIIEVLPQLSNMAYLEGDEDVVQIIPREYNYLLAVYATARLFLQDERFYESTTYMNEFETKLDEFRTKVLNGEITLFDPTTNEPLEPDTLPVDYVTDNYFFKRGQDLTDVDEGVEEVE